MNGHKISLERIAAQLEIIQDYISLKFGADFQEFCSVRGLPEMGKELSRKFEPDTFSYQLTPRKLIRPRRQDGATPAKRQKLVAKNSDDSDDEMFAINPVKVEWEDVVDEDGLEDVVIYDPRTMDNQPEDELPSDADSDPDYVDSEETSKRKDKKDKPKGPGRWPGQGLKPLDPQPQITITETTHKKPKLIINGYDYLFEKCGPSKRIWCCTQRRGSGCKSRIHTTDSQTNPELITEIGNHNHEPCAVLKPPKPEKKKRKTKPKVLIKESQATTTTIMSTIGGDLDILTNYLIPKENQT